MITFVVRRCFETHLGRKWQNRSVATGPSGYRAFERWKQHRCDDYVYIVYVEVNQQVGLGHGEGRGVVGFIPTNGWVLSEGDDPRAVGFITINRRVLSKEEDPRVVLLEHWKLSMTMCK